MRPTKTQSVAFLLAGWLPLFLALAQILRLQPAFDDPARSVEFLPGWTAYAGPASAYGANWLLLLSLSGTGALLGWGLWIECVGARHSPDWPRLRWSVLAGPLAAWGLLAVWGLVLDERHLHQDVSIVAWLLHAPTLLVSYAIAGSGLRSVRSLGLCGMILLALWAVTAAAQLHFDRPGQNDPSDWIAMGGSSSLALAVAIRLAIWGWVETPQRQPRAS